MLNRYREVLSIPGALTFSIAGIFARAPMAMVGISLILMVRQLYGSYSLAGVISAVGVVSFAVCAPVLSRMVDRYGQLQVMLPATIISASSLVALIIAAMNSAPPVVLMVLAVSNGATSGSIGALVRARWAFVTDDASQLQAAYAMEAAFDELVFVLGPVVATLVASSIHPTAGLWIAVSLQVVGSLAFLLQTSTQPPVNPKVKGEKLPSVMRNSAMIVLAITYVATGAMFGSMDLSVVANAEAMNMSFAAGMILAAMSLGSLISAVIYGSRIWSPPLWKLFIIGLVLMAIGVSPLSLAPNLIVLAVLMFIAGLAIAPTMTNVNTIVQRVTPATRLTEGLTWMSTAMTLGVSMGSAISGPVVDDVGYKGGYMATLTFAWLMVLFALVGLKRMRGEIAKYESPTKQIVEDVLENASQSEEQETPGHENHASDLD